MHVG